MTRGVGLRTVPRIGAWVRQPVGVVLAEGRGRALALGSALIVIVVLGALAIVDPVPGGMVERRGPVVWGFAAVMMPVLAVGGLAILRSAIRPSGVALVPEGVFTTRPLSRVFVPWPAIASVAVRTESRSRGPVATDAHAQFTTLVLAPGASPRSSGLLLSGHERARRWIYLDPRTLVVDLRAEQLARVIDRLRVAPHLQECLATEGGLTAVEQLVAEERRSAGGQPAGG